LISSGTWVRDTLPTFLPSGDRDWTNFIHGALFLQVCRKIGRRVAEAGSRDWDRKYERHRKREKHVERDDRVRSLLMKLSAGTNRDEAAGSCKEGALTVERI
jgi:hypothetical protein